MKKIFFIIATVIFFVAIVIVGLSPKGGFKGFKSINGIIVKPVNKNADFVIVTTNDEPNDKFTILVTGNAPYGTPFRLEWKDGFILNMQIGIASKSINYRVVSEAVMLIRGRRLDLDKGNTEYKGFHTPLDWVITVRIRK